MLALTRPTRLPGPQTHCLKRTMKLRSHYSPPGGARSGQVVALRRPLVARTPLTPSVLPECRLPKLQVGQG